MQTISSPGVFIRRAPAGAAPVVFETPRSGAEYPRWFASQAPLLHIQKSISSYVEEIYSQVTDAKAHWLYACFPNVVIDPNRHETDISPQQIDGVWPSELKPSDKCAAGIGLIPMVADGVQLYGAPLSVADVTRRLNSLYHPYHQELAGLLQRAKDEYGVAYHLSCHSMGSKNPANAADPGQRRSDFDLGNRKGTTCDPAFIDFVAGALRAFGYDVTFNKHFIGAEAVRKHGDPANHVHSLQIEMNRDLYMDEKTREKTQGFEQVKTHMAALAQQIVAYAKSEASKLKNR